VNIEPLVTTVLGLISGAVLTYWAGVVKRRQDLEAEYDKSLRAHRLEVYKELWKHLRVLARYDRPKPLVFSTFHELTISMRDWYFDGGGLYLSEEARKAYFALKDTIQQILQNSKYENDEPLDPADCDAVLGQASILRARLTKDVGTRKSSPVADS
jgi:hypothetical protein